LIFTELQLPGAFLIESEIHSDSRGAFARTYCRESFRKAHLHTDYPQANLSLNKKIGTLRGLHYQKSPCAEVKLVRCVQGSLYDVIVDLRSESPTFLEWQALELSAKNGHALYIPEGFAHGFQTLENDTLVYYHMGNNYVSSSARGIRWNDPLLDISWPLSELIISDKDTNYPNYVV